jgi:hypothetical protein
MYAEENKNKVIRLNLYAYLIANKVVFLKNEVKIWFSCKRQSKIALFFNAFAL